MVHSNQNSDIINNHQLGSPPGTKKVIDLSDPKYKLPFQFGWKREVVQRLKCPKLPSGKSALDIYYYSPYGHKLRTRNEIIAELQRYPNNGLSLDNFTFYRSTLGINNPEIEIVRCAKRTSRNYYVNNPNNESGPSQSFQETLTNDSRPRTGWKKRLPNKELKVTNNILRRLKRKARPIAQTFTKKKKTTLDEALAEITQSFDNETDNFEENSVNIDNYFDNNPQFQEPFQYGWKRIIVLHKRNESNIQSFADINYVYYISPRDKSCRTKADLNGAVSGSPLTLKNFSFYKRPIGINDPDKEIFRITGDQWQKHTDHNDQQINVQDEGVIPLNHCMVDSTVDAGNYDQNESMSFQCPENAKPSIEESLYFQNHNKTTDCNSYNYIHASTSIDDQSPISETSTHNLSNCFLPPTTKVEPHRNREETTKATIDTYIKIFEKLSFVDLIKVPLVSRVWRYSAMEPSLWTTVHLENIHIKNWGSFFIFTCRKNVKRLDLTKMEPNDIPWKEFASKISRAASLNEINFTHCPDFVIEEIVKNCSQMEMITIDEYQFPENEKNFLHRLKSKRHVTITLKACKIISCNFKDTTV